MKNPIRPQRHIHFTRILLVVSSIFAVPAISTAATVTNISTAGVTQVEGTAINLSTLGVANWAAWNSQTPSTTTFATLSPYATKATSSSGTISALSPLGPVASTVRGADTYTNYRNTFTWTTDSGTAPVPSPGGTLGILTGVFNSQLEAINYGIGFSITQLAPLGLGESYQISVLAAAYNGQGQMTATTGSSTVSQFGTSRTATNTRVTELFQFSYVPADIADELNLSFLLTTNGGGTSSHVGIQAVAITVIPEPSTSILLGGAAALLCIRSRRRCS